MKTKPIINIRCETCKTPLFDQMPGQYNKVCFPCFAKGFFFEITGSKRHQLQAARKSGAIENWKNHFIVFK
jgi:hypothetical protein